MPRIPALLLLCALPIAAYTAGSPGTASSAAAPAAAPAKAPAMSEDDKTLYAIGQILSVSVKPFTLSEAEMQKVQAGFAAGMRGKKSAVDAESYRPKIQALLAARIAAATEKTKAAGKIYRAKAAAAKGALALPSGLIVNTISAGTGAPPAPEDEVEVQYEGKLIDGTVFDSSIKRGQPGKFKVGGVIPCWTEGLQHMSVGGKSTLICPPELAYGDNGRPPPIPGGSTLVFQVELLKIDKAPPPAAPAAPAEPAAPAAAQPAAAPAAPATPAAAK